MRLLTALKGDQNMQLPPEHYRPCVGIMVFNEDGDIFVAKRLTNKKINDPNEKLWQMPQGGIDPGEDILQAAKRELFEETNIKDTDVKLISQTDDWLTYDLPQTYLKKSWNGKYKGQAQHWVLFQFTGSENDINVISPGGGSFEAEFTDWCWERSENVADLIIDFKRDLYREVISIFTPIIKQHLGQ